MPCTNMQCETTPLWDEASPKSHVVAVDEGACIAMAVDHREVNSLAGGKWLPSQVLRQTLVSLDELPPLTGILLREQLLYWHRDFAGVSTIPERVGKTELQGFDK